MLDSMSSDPSHPLSSPISVITNKTKNEMKAGLLLLSQDLEKTGHCILDLERIILLFEMVVLRTEIKI